MREPAAVELSGRPMTGVVFLESAESAKDEAAQPEFVSHSLIGSDCWMYVSRKLGAAPSAAVNELYACSKLASSEASLLSGPPK